MWKDIEIEDIRSNTYEVNTDGVIRNKKTKHVIKPFKDKDGYLKVSLVSDNPKFKNGKKKMFVHRIVALVFIPNPYNKPEVNHKHGKKDRPSVDELEWVTRKENARHQYDTGLQKPQIGEANHGCKTTEKTVKNICELLESNGKQISPKDICSILGLEYNEYNRGLIKHLKRRSSWSHICNQYDY